MRSVQGCVPLAAVQHGLPENAHGKLDESGIEGGRVRERVVARRVFLRVDEGRELRAGEQRDDGGGTNTDVFRGAEDGVDNGRNNVGVCKHVVNSLFETA